MEKKNQFGTMAKMTNVQEQDAHQIYKSQKSRNEIEVMFDGMKNILDAVKPIYKMKKYFKDGCL